MNAKQFENFKKYNVIKQTKERTSQILLDGVWIFQRENREIIY